MIQVVSNVLLGGSLGRSRQMYEPAQRQDHSLVSVPVVPPIFRLGYFARYACKLCTAVDSQYAITRNLWPYLSWARIPRSMFQSRVSLNVAWHNEGINDVDTYLEPALFISFSSLDRDMNLTSDTSLPIPILRWFCIKCSPTKSMTQWNNLSAWGI